MRKLPKAVFLGLLILWAGTHPALAQNAKAPSRFVDAVEQRLFILNESIEKDAGASERLDVLVYAIIVNACRFCAETYVFVETAFPRGRTLGAFECNYEFTPLDTYSNGLKDFLCARESLEKKITRYHLKYNGARYERQAIAQ